MIPFIGESQNRRQSRMVTAWAGARGRECGVTIQWVVPFFKTKSFLEMKPVDGCKQK